MTLFAPAFLLGMLAIGLPLWLHRLSSDNPNKQKFSSSMFLEPGEPRRVLAKKLQYLLLLALRIGVLVLLALAFAQPALWRKPEAAASGGARLHAIVLDGSASMGDGDRWERARAAAREVIDGLSGDDRGQLVVAGRQFEVLGPATGDASLLRQALNTVEPQVFRLDYGQLMRSIDALLRGAELPVVIDLVTDVQQSSLPTRFGELAPRRPAEVAIHDVSGGKADNWAIDSFGGSALTGELEASVRSFAATDARKSVRLTLNGKTIGEQPIEIAAGGRAQARFAALELASGPNRVTVSLEPGDDLKADDQRFLVLKRPQPRSVLLVSGDQRGRGALYLSSALGTLATLGLVPETRVPSKLTERPLAEQSFVVVTDAGLLGPGEIPALTDYVQNGGRVLLALGPRSAGLTAVPLAGEALRSGQQLGAAATESIGEIDTAHPALRGLDDLRSAKFTRYVGVEPGADDRVLIRLDDGAPLLLERALGAGRVLLFTSSLDREWNDLPVQPVFVPFIAGLANHLLGGAGFTSEADLGSTLAVRALGLAGGQIFDPRGQKALGLGSGSEDALLDQLGFYEVVGGGNTELVAVNFDPRESDLTRIDDATLERWKGLGTRAADQTPGSASAASNEPVPRPLGPLLMIALLLAAIVESWVGNWHLRIRRGLAA
jgi:Aerotolerance regulator N-terminal/von Willebrand factor type A domain